MKAMVQLHAANICRTVIAAARDLTEQHKAGRITAEQLQDAVVGHGHHRLDRYPFLNAAHDSSHGVFEFLRSGRALGSQSPGERDSGRFGPSRAL